MTTSVMVFRCHPNSSTQSRLLEVLLLLLLLMQLLLVLLALFLGVCEVSTATMASWPHMSHWQGRNLREAAPAPEGAGSGLPACSIGDPCWTVLPLLHGAQFITPSSLPRWYHLCCKQMAVGGDSPSETGEMGVLSAVSEESELPA